MAETVEHYLSRSLIKDDAKGGSGWRSVREVASVCDLKSPKMPAATRELAALETAGKVESALNGPHLLFRSTMTLAEARENHPSYIA